MGYSCHKHCNAGSWPTPFTWHWSPLPSLIDNILFGSLTLHSLCFGPDILLHLSLVPYSISIAQVFLQAFVLDLLFLVSSLLASKLPNLIYMLVEPFPVSFPMDFSNLFSKTAYRLHIASSTQKRNHAVTTKILINKQCPACQDFSKCTSLVLSCTNGNVQLTLVLFPHTKIWQNHADANRCKHLHQTHLDLL